MSGSRGWRSQLSASMKRLLGNSQRQESSSWLEYGPFERSRSLAPAVSEIATAVTSQSSQDILQR
ncbi:MAG: hypothetical protein AAGH67_14530 [Cyanobacteria bacterium P01_H01_bin.162]